MNDPYKVLNLSPGASEEDVKKAYRELVRKYHPDNYAGNPLSELAEEKMKELNEAYDTLMSGKPGERGGASSSSHTSYSRPSHSGSYSDGSGGVRNPSYLQIRQFISENNLVRAEELLHQCSPRDAEWYFLMGAIAHRKGWYDEALRYYETAQSMDPGNGEYGEAIRMMRQGGGGAYRKPSGGGEMSTCDCCTSLICADCLCECCGGNLIPCIGCR